MEPSLTEEDLLASIRAAQAVEARAEVLDAMTQLAAVQIAAGQTQEGADVLAYVRRCPQALPDTREQAEEHWEALACYACPRVLLDAEDFARKATYADVLEYVLLPSA